MEHCNMDTLGTEMEIDSDEDTETQLQELEQLNAVLEDDDDDLPSEAISQSSQSVDSTLYSTSQKCSKIEKAIALNKLTDEKLRRLEKILSGRLRECRQKLSVIRNDDIVDYKNETFRYFNCGKPYFKDKSNFSAPDNDDTILMAKSQMFDFFKIVSVPGWTVRDKIQFSGVMHKFSQEIKKKELNSKISEIKRKNKSNMSKEVKSKIAQLKREIDCVSKKSLSELALPINADYDWDAVANKLNRRHTAQEYKALWRLFIHPSINKLSWTRDEHMTLHSIACRNNLKDWDEIASKMANGRTGYQCFVYFRTNMTNSFSGRKWTIEEIEYLKRLVNYYKEDNYIPWGKVASSMENRTKVQIYNKYLRLVENRKGRFLREEDSVILSFVDRYGINFRKMTSYLPGRSMIQLRMRYIVLSKMKISTVWTVEEDKKLIQIMANHDPTMTYSSLTKFFPGKDRIHIRGRYLTLVKWMKRYPQRKLEDAPRRGAHPLSHGEASDNLNKAIENLKSRMESEVEIKKNKRTDKSSSESKIDDAVIATLVNEYMKDQSVNPAEDDNRQIVLKDNSVVSVKNLNMSNLRTMLVILNAKLDYNKFKESKYNNIYPGLEDPQQEVNLVKVKSYSRKNTMKTVTVNGYPDIWGNKTLGPLSYVLPPQYATITGCRVIMLHIGSQAHNSELVNLHLLMRRNCTFKEQIRNIIDRFITLFVWPMLLTDEGPEVFSFISNEMQSASKPPVTLYPKINLPHVPEVTIPKVKKSNHVNAEKQGIDLEIPIKKQRVIITEDIII